MDDTIYFILILYAILFAYLTWRHFYTALILLLALLPTYLIRFNIGPVPTTLLEVMIIIIAVIWLLRNLSRNTYHLTRIIKRQPTLFIATFLFLTGATISIFTSINTRAAWGEWKAFYIEPVLIFLVLATSLRRSTFNDQRSTDNLTTKSPNSFRTSLLYAMKQFNNETVTETSSTQTILNYLLFSLILSGLITSLLAIYQHFTGWMVPWAFWENQNTYRVTAWYGFPNGVGLFLAPLVPLALFLVKHNWEKVKRLKIMNNESGIMGNKKPLFIIHYSLFTLSLLFVPSSLLAIFYAKSTGGLVGIAAGIAILLLMRRKTRLPTIALGVVALIGLILTPNNNPIKQELLMQDRSGQLRLDIWAETSALLAQHPIVGAGLASYAQLIAPYRIDKTIEIFHHPHNIFLTMWVNIGFVGLVGFVWVVVWFFRLSARNTYHVTPNNGLIPYLLVAMTILITTGLVDSPYIKNDLAILFWLLPALLVIKTTNS